MPDPTKLSEKNRAKLDGIVQQMISNKESDDNIKFVVDDFKSKYAEKKNPAGSSTSTTPKENTELAPKTGSSVSKSTQGFPEIDSNGIAPDYKKMKTDVGPTSREAILRNKLANTKVTSENMDEVSAATDELSELLKTKHKTQYQNDEKLIQRLNTTDDNRTETDLADEKDDNQVTDYLREGAKNVGNVVGGIVNIFPKAINALSGNNLAIPTIDKFEKKIPLEKQLKQVQKEDPENKLTPQEKQQRAEELFREDSKKEQVKENFNNALTPGVLGIFASDFEEKKMLQYRLKSHEINKISNLTTDQKANSAQIQLYSGQGLALKKDIESDLAVVKAGKADTNFIQNLAAKQDKYKEVENKYLSLLDDQTKIKNTKLSVEENIEHFKLDYDPIAKAMDDTVGAFETPIGGALNLMGKASDALRKIPGAKSLDVNDGEKSALSVLGEKLIIDAENRSKSHRSIELNNIHSASDFGSYVTQVFTTAIPYLLGGIQYQAGKTILGSAAGTGFFMSGSGGKKAYDMDQEMKADPSIDYNNLQYLSAIAGYMGAEKLMLGGYDKIMKGAGATIESIGKNPVKRELFDQGIKTYFTKAIEGTGKFISGTNKSGMIGLTTGITRMATDNIALGKKSENPFKEMIDGYVNMAAMHLVMSGPPQIVKTGAYALSKVSEGKDKKQVAENYEKIKRLNEQLQKPDLTETDKNILNSAISLLHQDNQKTIGKSLEKLGTFTRSQVKELLTVDQEKLAIRKQVEALNSVDSGISAENKPELLKGLKAQFEAIEDRKMDVFNNQHNSLSLLPAAEQKKLMADAKEELYNTSKTDKEGNEVEITDKDIRDKATAIHLEQERFNGMDIKEIEVLKKTALKQLNSELTDEQKQKGITISNYEITKRAIENHNKTIVNETEASTTTEAPQSEQNSTPGIEEKNGTFYVTDKNGVTKGFSTKEEAQAKLNENQSQDEVQKPSEAEKVELKNEGKADIPTKENIDERLRINHPFYEKVSDALNKLGLINKYNPETKEGDVVGGYTQPTSDGGFSVGSFVFSKDGSVSFIKDGARVEFDKNGNVISENTKEVAQEKNKIEIEGTKGSITNLEKTRDSEAFKYKEATETDVLGNDGKPAGNPAGKKNGGGIDLKSTPDQILEWLDQQEKNLDNFGKENLSVGIPIVLAKGAIQAMRVAVKAGKLAAEVIQAGLDHVKQNDWYKNLTQKEKDEIDNDFQGNFLNKINAIDPSNEKQAENLLNRAVSENISEDDAYDEVKTTFEKARTELANKKLPTEYVRDAYRNFIKRFSDRQYLAKMLLNKSGMKAVQNLIINSHGTSGKARIQFQEAYDKIYKGLTTEERKTLDEVIQAKRFIAIDTNREARGLEPVSHPNFIDKNKSEKFLSKLEKEIGTEKYNDLVQRANAYFDTYKGLLKDMLDNGLISQASFDSMSDVDYQPRVFLQYITDFNGDMETNKRTNNLDTGGLSSDQIKAMSEGDANSLVLNSEWLLANSLLARSKAMAMNNINKRFMTDEYQKAKARFDALDPKNLKGDDARFYKYFKELSSKVIDNPIIGQTESGNNKYKYDKTPLNYAKMYYYIDGQQHQFFLEKDLHESWNDNIGGFLSSDAKEFLSYASGSALVKAIATGNNPAFPIVNTPRDFMFNIAFSDQYSKLVPKAMFQVAKDVASSVKEIAKKDSEVLKKYIEYGGAMDFLSSQGRLKKESVIGKILEKNISANTRDTSKKVFDAVTLHKISAYSEMMFRLGVFQRTIKNQVKELGLQDISEVTDKQQRDDIYNQAVANARSMMDFNQGGSITKDLESVIPYINAATQGGRVAISSFEKDPVGTTARLLQIATIASTVPIGISLALISAMKSDDDEDKTASEIYLHAMSGISKYQKSKYMNIVTGVKDDEGEYQVLKIAKSQELSPVISVTDDIYANLLRKIAGKEKKSAGSITQDALFTLNSNVMPIDVTSPAGLITRTPMVKAVLTYQTGYDFFRDEPLSMDIGKVPLAVEGINQSSTEDFYKKLGPNFGLSPIRSKAFVESLITGPSTNPFVGMLYGGADAATSDKDMKKIGAELFNTIYKSTGKRVVSYSTDFNRKLSGQQELQKEIDAINIEKHLNKAKFKELGNQFLNKEITQKELNTELEKLDPYERQMALSRIKDLRQLKGVSGTVLDIKYEREAKAKALMIMHYYGDIFDGRKENSEVKKEMMRAKGIITPKVMFEYNKLKEELNKKTPN